MKTRTEIINYLISTYGYSDYLEIGTYDPQVNFNNIVCKNKVAVDPEPKAPFIIPLTSDEYFRTHTQKFDLVFIDGLHEGRQVVKDITNALGVLKPNGTIVVHDCNPTSEAMQAVPRVQGEWTGDVWKAWLSYRQFDNLSMKVLNTDYGVGIIRDGKQQSLPKVDPISYENFAVNKTEWLPLIPVDLEPVSVCIPAFEQYGYGHLTLKALLETIMKQSFKDYEIIVSDNANDDSIKRVCMKYPVRYVKNKIRGISANTNNAIKYALHSIIKPMYQDDKFISTDAIERISFAMKFNNWVACNGLVVDGKGNYNRAFEPRWTEDILNGNNRIGMPSVVAFRKNDIVFDEQLKVMLDAEYYYLLKQRLGEPGFIRKQLIGSRRWQGSTSVKQGNETFLKEEVNYLKEKHAIL